MIMGLTNDHLQAAIAAAERREVGGYFTRVAAGDQRAASLFVRLVAADLNPHGDTTGFGWLSKAAGESQVDGYAEDAIVFGADPSDRQNVIDLVNGAGAEGASIGGAVKERRPNNTWVKPQALAVADLQYLLSGGTAGGPIAPSRPQVPYVGDEIFDAVGEALFADYRQAGQAPNPLMGRWFGRTIWDATEGDERGVVLTISDAILKHRANWRSALGLLPK